MTTISDAVDRLQAMADDDGRTWDLSPNDVSAIRAILKERETWKAATRPPWLDVPEADKDQGNRYYDLWQSWVRRQLTDYQANRFDEMNGVLEAGLYAIMTRLARGEYAAQRPNEKKGGE